MEKIKPVPLCLLNIPPEIIEEIFLYLALPDRKNLRLTCKLFYELCNLDRFCRDEIIIWSESLINHVNVKSNLCPIGRRYYNLAINYKTLEKPSILPFFQEHGAKVQSLDIDSCKFLPGTLEYIIMQCENLSSLCLTSFYNTSYTISDCSAFEPLTMTRPHVTYLKLTLPPNEPNNYFHRMFSIFPNVKELHIEAHPRICNRKIWKRKAEEYSPIFEAIMKLGRNLDGLGLKIPPYNSVLEGSKLFETLPHLKALTVDFNHKKLSGTADWYPYCSNLVSIVLVSLADFHPPDMIRILTNTGLKYLRVVVQRLSFDIESFRKFVTSQLDTIKFFSELDTSISDSLMTILDSPLEANKSVKYLYMIIHYYPYTKNRPIYRPYPTEILFTKYFRGLVHLTIETVTDSILQSIFQWQENVRSLEFQHCLFCSISGFCGSKDGGSGYSMNNLQKLEHLSIYNIRSEIVTSDDFRRAFRFPRLKYLHIDCVSEIDDPQSARIPIGLFENLTELRALYLRGDAVPLCETFPSSFRSLQHLNYLRIDEIHRKKMTNSVTFIKIHGECFSDIVGIFKHKYSSERAYHDKESDRFVILNACLYRKLYVPKIGAFKINWIEV